MFANGGVSLLVVSALLFSAVLGAPSILQPYNVFTSQIQEDVKLRFIKNSGVCETAPGVLQMSGYIDIGTNMSMVSFAYLKVIRSLMQRSGSGFLKQGITQRPRHLLSGNFNVQTSHPQCLESLLKVERRSGLLVDDRAFPRCELRKSTLSAPVLGSTQKMGHTMSCLMAKRPC